MMACTGRFRQKGVPFSEVFQAKVHQRVGILLLEVYERIGKFVISACKMKAQNFGLTGPFYSYEEVEKTFWFWSFISISKTVHLQQIKGHETF